MPDFNRNSGDSVETIRSVRVVPRSYRSLTGHFASRLGPSIQFESSLERDFLTRYDFDLSVQRIVSQPCRVLYTQENGRQGHYTPDFLVIYRQDPPQSDRPRPLAMLVEVKPSEDWRKHWRKWSRKWMAARRYALQRGWIFRIMDESRIRDERLANINYLNRYRRSAVTADVCARLLLGLGARGPSTVGSILKEYFGGCDESAALIHVWHLVATRQLDANVDEPLTTKTVLWVPDVKRSL